MHRMVGGCWFVVREGSEAELEVGNVKSWAALRLITGFGSKDWVLHGDLAIIIEP